METLCEALRDPLFDEQLENRWFEKADTDAATFVATLELWLSLTGDLQKWMLDEEASDEPFNVPGKYVRLTTVAQQLLGDGPSGHRLCVRSFDTTPLSEVRDVFSRFEWWLESEREKKEQADKWGDDLSEYEVDDQFPMTVFELDRLVRGATDLVERALVGQVKDYRHKRDQRRKGYVVTPFEFVTPITREQQQLGALAANGWKPPAGENEDVPCLVTITQMAAMVHVSKKTLERFYAAGDLPAPTIEGGKGRAHKWDWAVVREPLSDRFNLPLPERFPADRLITR